MAELTADERRTLGARKWQLERDLDAWDERLVRPPNYDETVAERDRIVLALTGGEAGQVIGDAIKPQCMVLARNITVAIERLQQELDAADAFTSLYGNLDRHGQDLVSTLAFPPGADPREATSDTRKWLDRAIRYGLVPR